MGKRKNNLTSEEQFKWRDSARRKLLSMETQLADRKTIELLDDFKNRFNLCEMTYKDILRKYLAQTNQTNKGHLKITMTQVPAALNMAGYSFDKQFLAELFGGKRKQTQTAKILRDGVTHGLSPKAVKEIVDRKEELFRNMEEFLNGIREADKIP